MTPLTVGSMFSGIGGLDLGLGRAGMRVVWQSEIDPYCCRVLARHWPDVPNLGDVTRIDWKEIPRVDVICGGYPCQPFSQAGRRLGEQDPRHLWPFMRDAIRVLRPRFALLENVSGHLALGFGRVLGDLAEIGYDCEWDCIPAAAVGAPHRRDRVFVVAYPHGGRHGGTQDGRRVGRVDRDDAGPPRERERSRPLTFDRSPAGHVADTDGTGLEGSRVRGPTPERRSDVADTDVDGRQGQQRPPSGRDEVHAQVGADADGRRAGVAHLADSDDLGRDGRTGRLRPAGWPQPAHGRQWLTEPDVGRVAHGVPHRVDRLRALGNAVVPQVAEHIGRLIIEAAA